jgi:hypothetical protein
MSLECRVLNKTYELSVFVEYVYGNFFLIYD